MVEQSNHPAFPCEAQPDRNVPPEHDYIQTGSYSGKFPGITIRDYFAAKALTGLMLKDPWGDPNHHAVYAYNAADAMLAERSKAGATS